MATSFELVNRAMEGGLAQRLRDLHAEGKSLKEITESFNEDGFDVGLETVRRWCHRIGLPTHRVPAAAPEGLAG